MVPRSLCSFPVQKSDGALPCVKAVRSCCDVICALFWLAALPQRATVLL